MPRTIPIPLLTHLQGPVLTTAILIGITRTDGVFIGLTTSNVPLTYAPTGAVYEAIDSMAASQLRQSASTGVDNLLVSGVLTSNRITDQDLLAGRYDGASLDLSVVNYQEVPLVNRALLVTGTLGEVTFMDGQYQAEFRSLSQRLQQKIATLTSATCRVRQLFDAQCFVGGTNYAGNLTAANFQYSNVPVVLVKDQQAINFTDPGTGTGRFNYGRAQFTTGANAGIQLEIKQSSKLGSALQLIFVAPWSLPVNVGDTAFLEEGCDRTFSVCTAKFQNAGNNRSEPYIVGNTRVIRWGRR